MIRESEKDFLNSLFEEEKIAKIKGWDFSHLDGRWEDEEALPWDYKKTVLNFINSEMKLLDIDTGGGEFVCSLNHPYENIFVTENYAPNFEFCKERLSPLGITVKNASAHSLPFEDESFDIVLNRHGDLNASEFFRVLKKGGIFITQQVGAYNDREFVELLIPDTAIPYPEQTLKIQKDNFEKAGFVILEKGEAFFPIRFFDVGALVWFAKIIEWEFPDFSVEKYSENLIKAKNIIDKDGYIEGKAHRFYFVAKK